MLNFNINFTGIADVCCRIIRGESSCQSDGGCVQKQQPCLLHKVKENWVMIGVAVNLDNHIMRLMNDVNGKFDKARANKRMSEIKKTEIFWEFFPTWGGGGRPNPKNFVIFPSHFWHAKFILRC